MVRRPQLFGGIQLLCLTLLVGMMSGGCGHTAVPLENGNVTVFVPGAGGDGGWYNGVRRALSAEDLPAVSNFHWGAPTAAFVMNLQDRSIHEAAEARLATIITDWRQRNPEQRINLVGHSAGCGVILGAIGRLDPWIQVNNVVLLSPSVSPGYDLSNPLAHVRGRLYSFYSEHDVAALKWRTGTFGTYDNVRTPAAGHMGFEPEHLPVDLRQKLVQFPYQSEWLALGNDGSHTGSIAEQFVAEKVRPLLRE